MYSRYRRAENHIAQAKEISVVAGDMTGAAGPGLSADLITRDGVRALRIAAEPAAAVGVAALLSGAYRPAPDEHVAVVISGANMTPSGLGA
jgi:threonine dehydratase